MMKRPAIMILEPAFAEAIHAAGLDRFEDIMALPSPPADVMKAGVGRVTIRWVINDRTYFLKRFRNTWSARQARNEWTMLRQLRAAGIDCAVPAALGERRSLFGVRESFLVTEKIPEATDAYRWLRANPDRRRELLAPLAAVARRFHDAGYCHKDFYLGHFFVQESPSLRIFLIDLQRCRRPIFNRRRWLVKDLAALHYSLVVRAGFPAEEWKEFLSHYGAVDSRLCRSVESKSARIARHHPRYG